jgi:hypothetical protein
MVPRGSAVAAGVILTSGGETCLPAAAGAGRLAQQAAAGGASSSRVVLAALLAVTGSSKGVGKALRPGLTIGGCSSACWPGGGMCSKTLVWCAH